jgi:hypothetical protein
VDRVIVRAPVSVSDDGLSIRYAALPAGVRGYTMVADEGATMVVRISDDDRDAAESAGLEEVRWEA